MNVLVAGASGLVGTAVSDFLSKQGHCVIALQRTDPDAPAYWNVEEGVIQLDESQSIDVVINLAGEGIATGRWNKDKKARIMSSRVKGTQLLAAYFSKLEKRPRVFLSASAAGFYGDCGSEDISELHPKGSGFLAEVCERWEAATSELSDAEIRVAHLRFGMILSGQGGALKTMLPPFKLGLGGRIGSGSQYMSWISISDVVGIIHHLMQHDEISGPINMVSPGPVTNSVFTQTLGRVLRRPTLCAVPAFVAKVVWGEMAGELLLVGSKVVPQKLQQSGYEFLDPDLEGALKRNI